MEFVITVLKMTPNSERKMCSMNCEFQIGLLTCKESGGMCLATGEAGTILIHDAKIHHSVMQCLSH